MFRVLDLFSGIGGFSLGLERTGGFKTIAFCEIEAFCQQHLARRWPGVPCFDDVRKLDGRTIRADVICGGFPCQDISLAGNLAGLGGERSGLWTEYARLIGEIRPRYVIVENVANLLTLGMGDILRDLAAIRYDAEWHCIPASAIGAPHIRDRVWIIAYPADEQTEACVEGIQTPKLSRELGRVFGRMRIPLVDHPPVCFVDDGLSIRVDEHEALGNSIVPYIAEMIGQAIILS